MHPPTGRLLDGGAGPAQELLKLPLAAAAGLARDDQIEAGHERNELAATAGLGTGILGNALTAATAPEMWRLQEAIRSC